MIKLDKKLTHKVKINKEMMNMNGNKTHKALEMETTISKGNGIRMGH